MYSSRWCGRAALMASLMVVPGLVVGGCGEDGAGALLSVSPDEAYASGTGGVATGGTTASTGGQATGGQASTGGVSSTAGTVATGGMVDSAGITGSATVGETMLTFAVTTEPFAIGSGKDYKPRNIGAIWVETADGTFVKTLKRWAATRKRYLTAFTAASGGDVTDATTSATLSSHITHTVTWDFTDRSGAEVADGSYRLRVEGTDVDGTGPNISVPFTKGTGPGDTSMGSDGHFLNMSIHVE